MNLAPEALSTNLLKEITTTSSTLFLLSKHLEIGTLTYFLTRISSDPESSRVTTMLQRDYEAHELKENWDAVIGENQKLCLYIRKQTVCVTIPWEIARPQRA